MAENPYRVQDMTSALNDVDGHVFPAKLGVVLHDVLLAQVIDLRSCLHAGRSTATHDKTEQSCPFLWTGSGKCRDLEVVNDALSDLLRVANRLELVAVLEARNTVSCGRGADSNDQLVVRNVNVFLRAIDRHCLDLE